MELRSKLLGPVFSIGTVIMIGGTLIQELILSTEYNGVTTDVFPPGLFAAVATGLAVGFVTRDREKGLMIGFACGYVGVTLGSGLFAGLHWGLKPEAGPYGWAVFLAGGLIVGVAIGWVAALLAAGSGYLGAMLDERSSNRRKVIRAL